jgi:hypothetical protein
MLLNKGFFTTFIKLLVYIYTKHDYESIAYSWFSWLILVFNSKSFICDFKVNEILHVIIFDTICNPNVA